MDSVEQQGHGYPRRKGLLMFARKQDIPLFLLATTSMALASVGSPIQTFLYGEAFNKLAKYLSGKYIRLGSFISDVRHLCLMIMVVGVARMLLTWFSIYVWLIIGERQQKRARAKLLSSLLRKSFAWFDKKANLMGSMAQVNRCIEEIREATSENLAILVQGLSSIILLLISAMISSWSLTLIILASSPLMALSSTIFGKMTFKYASEENAVSAKASKILNWSFVSGDIVRLLDGKFRDSVNFNRKVDQSAKAFTKMCLAIGLNESILRILSLLIFVQGFWFGAHMVSIGRLGIGQVFTAFSSCLILGTHISNLASVLADLNKGQAAATTFSEFLEGDTETQAIKTMSCQSASSFEKDFEPILLGTQIRFKNVTFSYQDATETSLRDIDISIKCDRVNFIVGPSGCGKSTMVSLLLRFYEPSAGEILIDGHDISTLRADQFEGLITFVESRSFVFERSLYENLTLGMSDVPESEVLRACNFAELGAFVESLSDGIHSKLSSSLSGGQIQRIGLARAFIRNSAILVMDEALSAIDFATRRKLMRKIRDWRMRKMTIIITHDMSEVETGDNLISLRAGKLEKVTVSAVVEEEEMKSSEVSWREPSSNSISVARTEFDEGEYLQTDIEAVGERAELRILSILEILKHCYAMINSKIYILCGLCLSIISGVLTPILSYCFSKLLSNIVTQSSSLPPEKHGALFWSSISIGLTFFDGVAHFFSKFLLKLSSERWVIQLRKQALAVIDDQDVSLFGRKHMKPAELTALIMNDARDLRNLISEFLSGALSIIALTMMGLIWTLVSGWKLAMVGLAFVPVSFLITYLYGSILSKFETSYKNIIARIEKLNHNAISGVKTIKALGIRKDFEMSVHEEFSDLSKTAKLRACFTGLGFALQEMCTSIATGTILYYGLFLVARFEYTYEQTLQVLTLFSFTITSASTLMGTLPEIARGKRAGTLFVRLLGLSPSPIETAGEIRPTRDGKVGQAHLSFEDVGFSYAQDERKVPILQNLSFEITRGELVGIVGLSGSGKSTVASLVGRLIDCETGKIKLQSKEIKELDPSWYHKHVGVVPQHPRFFEGTVWENLTYGIESAFIDKAFVVDCLKLCNIWHLIASLHQGLDAKLDERLVSSGELQRLCIARALVREPSLLVFDECSSNLDAESAEVISSLVSVELQRRYPNLTIIVITHDTKMMRRLPRLLVLKDGRITQDGNYSILSQKEGALRQLVSR